jgi:hypothetical protein
MTSCWLTHAIVLSVLFMATGLSKSEAESGVSFARHLPYLKVSLNRRFLITEGGKPFFWMGDTAWCLTAIPPSDVDLYLNNRARHRFNVIQVLCARPVRDYAGRLPFRDNDPLSPNEEYWRNVDSIVERAEQRGIYVALVPLWGAEYGRLFGNNADRAGRFGRWIGARYASRSNVLWIASGEYDSINGFRVPLSAEQKGVITSAAQGIRAATVGKQIITLHPGAPRTSSQDFHNEDWLDLDMLQSGHVVDFEAYHQPENYALIAHDYALKPTKPVFDGEPIYEDTPDAIWTDQSVDRPRANAAAVRRKAYWSVFAGACGHTYGHNDVYGFYVPSSPGFVLMPTQGGSGNQSLWKTCLDAPGAVQMKHLRSLIESRPFLTQAPDLTLLASDPGSGKQHVGALRGDGYALIYSPLGRPFSARMDALHWREARATWFDPRTGKRTSAGRLPATGNHDFDPPGEPGDGNDWVLELVRSR